jgi:hypothetical protein
LGRIINPEGAGKQRQRLSRSIVLAIRELMKQSEINRDVCDLASYIALGLAAIDKTIDQTVEPWEKRGYWIKADRFRLQWDWTQKLASEMRTAILHENWQTVALITAKVAEELGDVDIPKRHKLGTPWNGAWDELRKHFN